MHQRDILKDQIEQMGKVLAKIIADFFNLKSAGYISKGKEIADQQLKSLIDIDMEKVFLFDKTKLSNYLIQRKLTAYHLELLSEYIREAGVNNNEDNKQETLLRFEIALELLDIADEVSKIISLDRINKKIELKIFLETIRNSDT